MDKRLIVTGAASALLTAALATTALGQSPAPLASPLASPMAQGSQAPAPLESIPAVQADPPHPAHIHNGLCPKPGDIAQPLNDLVIGTDQPVGVASAFPVEVSVGTVPMSLNDILASEHSINVHQSADAMDKYIACGDIGGHMLGDNALAIGLNELNGSGHRGVAWLQDNGDGSTSVNVFLINESFVTEPGQGGTPSASGNPTETTVPVTTTVPQATVLPIQTTVPSQVPVMTVVPSIVPSVVPSVVATVVPQTTTIPVDGGASPQASPAA